MSCQPRSVAHCDRSRGAFVSNMTDDEKTLAYCRQLRLITIGDVERYLELHFEGRRLKYAFTDDEKANYIRAAYESFLRE